MYDEPFDFDAPTTKAGVPPPPRSRHAARKITILRGLVLGTPVSVSIWLLLFVAARMLGD